MTLLNYRVFFSFNFILWYVSVRYKSINERVGFIKSSAHAKVNYPTITSTSCSTCTCCSVKPSTIIFCCSWYEVYPVKKVALTPKSALVPRGYSHTLNQSFGEFIKINFCGTFVLRQLAQFDLINKCTLVCFRKFVLSKNVIIVLETVFSDL